MIIIIIIIIIIPTNPFHKMALFGGQCFLDGRSLRQVNGSFSCLCGHLRPRRLQSNDGLLGTDVTQVGQFSCSKGPMLNQSTNGRDCAFSGYFLIIYCNRKFVRFRMFRNSLRTNSMAVSFSRFWRVFWGVLPPSTDINSKASGLTGSGVEFVQGRFF